MFQILPNPTLSNPTLVAYQIDISRLGASRGLNIWQYGVHENLSIETLEKFAQRDVQSMKDLMEVVCVWVSIKEPLRVYVGDAAFTQLEEMFMAGTLDFKSSQFHLNLGAVIKTRLRDYVGRAYLERDRNYQEIHKHTNLVCLWISGFLDSFKP